MHAISMPWLTSIDDAKRLNNMMLCDHEIHQFQSFKRLVDERHRFVRKVPFHHVHVQCSISSIDLQSLSRYQ